MPIGAVEELLLHVVIQAGPWRTGWMLVVEDQLGRLVVPRLQEAHDLPIVGSFVMLWLLAMYGGQNTRSDDLRLEVRRRAALGDGQVGRVTQRVDMRLPLHLQRGAIGRDPALGISQ